MNIGEVARRAGISVRTLRHYDRIGLLPPSGRTEAGYRIYEARDIARLHQIRVLQQLGFSLSDIARLLDAPQFSPQALVAMQLSRSSGRRCATDIGAHQILCAFRKCAQNPVRAGRRRRVS